MFNVCILWHMHQPYYVNPLTKTAMMPWVRLHSVKGYLDMIDISSRFPELRMSFNFTPVLVRQIRELADRSVIDLWETWSRKTPDQLTEEEKGHILENFFKINWDNLITPFPRYRQLLEIRGRNYDLTSLRQSVRHFSDKDYRDLQTWYNLSWCGYSAEKRYPELTELKKKGSGFSEEEKLRVLNIHHEIVSMVLGLYREAQEREQAEITTTPFFHPIMPLVYDTDIARRCMPGRELPSRFTAPEDVKAHLHLAQEQHEAVFGRKARGLWPSEGSICPEILPPLREAGIEYFCTDEGNLFRSLQEDPQWRGQMVDHVELFQPWWCEHEGVGLKALFRERPLSDFLGFNAARNTPEGAAEHLIHHSEHIASVCRHPHGVLTLALDGENAWESFPDGGEKFLTTWYHRMVTSSSFKTRRMGDYLDEVHECPRISKLHSGSWINSDFDIWIGDAEENTGWEWLGKTRDFLVAQIHGKEWPEDVLKKAWMEIYAAEGSDWFWWYGPDFQTDCDFLFDELFRTHLQNVYRLLSAEPPKYLEVPICLNTAPTISTQPFDFISPTFNSGSSYFDWLGAARFDIQRQQTAMFQADRIARGLYYGFNLEKFFFQLELLSKTPQRVILYFHQPQVSRVILDCAIRDAWLETSPDGVNFTRSATKLDFSISDRLEVGVPSSLLGWRNEGETAAFVVQLLDGKLERERYPERGLIEFTTPSPRFRMQNWFI